MRRLTRLLSGRRANGERGAVLVLTAFLVMFVAIGMLALTVDLGNVTYNRAELQNGADASSLALATACANATASSSTPCGVNSDLTDLAVENSNVTDQSMTVLAPPTSTKTCINDKGKQYVTAHGGTPALPPCSDPTAANISDLSTCQPWPMSYAPDSVSYVEVTTQTKMENGTSILPFHFAQILTDGKYVGSTSETCARTAWGPAGSTGATLPITMGQCDWDAATSAGENYAPAPSPQYDPPPFTGANPPSVVPSADIVGIFLHDPKSTEQCAAAPNGGFNWLAPDAETKTDCHVTIESGDPAAQGSPGNAPSCDISSYVGKVVAVPIYDSFKDGGSNATYNIVGISEFYLAGYTKLKGGIGTKAAYAEPASVCPVTDSKCKTGSLNYLWGWFTTGLLPIDSTIDPGGEYFGASVVAPAG